MEEIRKKSNKGLIVFLVILVLLLLGGLGFGAYKYMELDKKHTDLNRSYKEITKNIETVNKDLDITKGKLLSSDGKFVEIKDIVSDSLESYKLYSISRSTAVVGFSGKIYYFDLGGLSGEYDNCIEHFLYEKPIFRNGEAICSPDADEDQGSGKIYETDLKESDLYKAISSSIPSNTGYNYAVFFILKDGSVKVEAAPELKLNNKLAKYKIKDIKKFYCSSGYKTTCKGPLKLDIVLQNDSEETVELG